jgi:hypothetical protein
MRRRIIVFLLIVLSILGSGADWLLDEVFRIHLPRVIDTSRSGDSPWP